MKYPSRIYAKALSETLAKPLRDDEGEKTMRRFLAIVKRNGDAHLLKKILNETERYLRMRTGRRKVVLETARPIPPANESIRKAFSRFIRASDIVEDRLNPSLLAGIRVVVDDTVEFDNSLKRKLDVLFKT